MIYDHISNIDFYKGISANIYEGMLFLKQANHDLTTGIYEINPHVKVIVSEYETKEQNEYGYEAHRNNIDIQCLIDGSERISCLPIEKLQETMPYSEEIDAAFYKANVQPMEMKIGDGYFVVFFPQDGHMPQLCVSEPEMVKKIVVKVEI